MSLLVARDLCKAFGGVVAAKNVTFEVGRGELLALIGPNGAGKTTTFNMVGGQLRPDAGHVILDGEDVTRCTPRQKFRRGVGRTFQIAQTFLSMTVAENVQMALMTCRRRHHSLLANARRLYRDEALSTLAQVGMVDQADRSCSTLAYGDVKRVELAVALASGPKLLLMDEPTAGMAPRERADLMRLAARIAREREMGVLFTEHDMDAVFAHADRVLVLVRGEIIAAGAPDEVRADARVRQAYLGATGAAAAERARRSRGDG
jgi:branched-chain amino acid transport system ATP-binding protein